MMRVAELPQSAPATVLACGAYLKNTACLIDGRRVLWSAPHGDLIGVLNRQALEDSVEDLLSYASGPIQAIAHDLHPDIYSTELALSVANRLGIPAIAVQHHHAHIAVVQAEQAVVGPVIGLALDGVGFGTDASAWGGEILWVDSMHESHHWRRLGSLTPISLPGGDIAAREPWRMAAAVLHSLGRTNEIETRFAPIVGLQEARTVRLMLLRQINTPGTTSAGRWFDAAAGALGLSVRQTMEAQAAMILEQQAHDWLQANPEFEWHDTSPDLAILVARLIDMADNEASLGQGAAIFHIGLANILACRTIKLATDAGISTIVLGGGCFLNKLLSARLIAQLQAAGLVVLRPESVCCGDSGLALGQAWVAACTVNGDQKSAAIETHPLRKQPICA